VVASGSSNRRPLSGPCNTRRVNMGSRLKDED
jgi:hypothetical protein